MVQPIIHIPYQLTMHNYVVVHVSVIQPIVKLFIVDHFPVCMRCHLYMYLTRVCFRQSMKKFCAKLMACR